MLSIKRDLSQITYQLKDFKTHYDTGVDVYADYRRPEREKSGRESRRIAEEAANLYTALIDGQTNGQVREKLYCRAVKLANWPWFWGAPDAL